MNLDKRFVLAPRGLREEILSEKKADPSLDFLLYSYKEAEDLLGYRYGNRAINFLLKKGYSLTKASKTLRALSYVKGSTARSGFLDSLHEVEKELLLEGVLYWHPDPHRLIEGYKPLVIGYPKCRKIELLLRRLGFADAEYEPYDDSHSINAPYAFEDIYGEGNFLLNNVAALLEEGVPPEEIHIYGLSDRLSLYVEQEAPRYGFGIDRSVLLSDTPLFKAFINKLSHDDAKLLESLVAGKEEAYGAKQLAKLVERFDGIEYQRRRALYLEAARGRNVIIPSPLKGPKIAFTPYVPKGHRLFVVGAYFGVLPQSQAEDPFFSDEDKALLGLATSRDDSEMAKLEASRLLKHEGLLYASYSYEIDPASYLFTEKPILNPTLDREYSNDQGALLQSFLLDEKEETLREDPRLAPLGEARDIKHGTFPYAYGQFPIPQKKERSYSYSALKEYNSCRFSYYLKYILRLKDDEDSFPAFLGTYTHAVLCGHSKPGFDLDKARNKAYEEAMEGRKTPLSAEESMILRKIDDTLPEIIDRIVAFENSLNPASIESEYGFDVDIGDGIRIKGRIDENIYIRGPRVFNVILDFKTGHDAFSMKRFNDYGLDAQLPIYALAVSKDEKLGGREMGAALIYPIFPAKQKYLPESIIEEGENPDQAEFSKATGLLLDADALLNSEIINQVSGAQKYTKKQEVSSKYKGLPEEAMKNVIDKAEEYIRECDEGIVGGSFEINPKNIKNVIDSCQYCPFRDVCYRDQKAYKESFKDSGVETTEEEDGEFEGKAVTWEDYVNGMD